MKNVLLVDDEPWVLLGLQRIFNWEKYGFHVIAAVSSSEEALEILRSNIVHVIVSDIRMPDITGLELLKKAKAFDPSITVILISGFADFEYAQDALRHGAYDYLLKPIDENETDRFLDRLANDLLEQEIQNNLFLYDQLIQGKKLLPSFFPKVCYPYYQAFILYSEQTSQEIPEPDNAIFTLLHLDRHQTVYLCNTAADLKDYLLTRRISNANCGISSASPAPLAVDLPRQALSAFRYSFFTGKPSFYIYHPTDYQLVQSLNARICENSKCNHAGEIANYLKSLPVEKFNTDDIVFLWNQFRLCFPELLVSQDDFCYTGFSQLQQDFKNWDSLIETMCDICSSSTQESDTNINYSSNRTLFRQIIAYIQDHYTEELYLRDISEHFYLSFNYCCGLFQKYMGTTFSKYLTKIRMQRAAELLCSSTSTIEAISLLCGYKDYSYFNKVFRRYYSCTPSQYRKGENTI